MRDTITLANFNRAFANALLLLVAMGSLVWEALHRLFDGVPDSVDPQAVRDCLCALPGVARVHDLQLRATGTSQIAAR